MKKVLYIGITVLLVFSFYSCNESFLNTMSSDTYNEANWWKTENQAISSINGCYSMLRSSQIGGNANLSLENVSPNSYNMSGEILLATGNHNSGNDMNFKEKWEANYQGIGRVNTLLDNIDKILMDAALSKRIKAEAYFLRAYFYYNLVSYFGGVPLILETPNLAKHRSLPRNTRKEVVDQVFADLNNAAAALPLSYTGSNIGRATKGAVLALKTRYLLYEGSWSEAAQTAKEVMNLKLYDLYPDYRGLFMPENESNKEVIFDVQYKVPEYSNSFDNTLEVQINLAPTLDLVRSYLMIDGKSIQESPLYNPSTPYINRDPRFLKTIVIPGNMFVGKIVTASKYFSTGFGFKKYTSYKDDVAQAANIQSQINFIVLRYADILLMYAEAQNEVAGSDASVYSAINQVRSRAGMPSVPAGLSKDQMREVIRLERRIELVGEALYYNDIRRWHTAETVMNAKVLNSKGEVIQTRTFNKTRDYLWPIHELTIQENPALKQNPGY